LHLLRVKKFMNKFELTECFQINSLNQKSDSRWDTSIREGTVNGCMRCYSYREVDRNERCATLLKDLASFDSSSLWEKLKTPLINVIAL
jgi:hypothetical protein